MEYLSYKGGCGVHGCTCIEVLKRKLAWPTDKWLRVINSYTTKKLKNSHFKSKTILYALLCLCGT